MASVTINAPAKKVWETLTRPALRKQWFFGVDTETDWKVGSPIVHRGEFQGKPYEDKGIIKQFEPEKKIVHTHWSSMSGKPDKPENYETITYSLTERDGRTEVDVGEVNVASAEQRAISEKMWKPALDTLKKVAEG